MIRILSIMWFIGQVHAVIECEENKASQSIYLTLGRSRPFHLSPQEDVNSCHTEDKYEINLKYEFKTTESKWPRCWEVEMCDGSGTGRVKGTSSETTMQIPRHFVWQATTLLCIYAKPGKTLCTQPCCQCRVMLEWWHPMDDPCLQWGYWARLHTSLRHTNTCKSYHMQDTSHLRGQTWRDAKIALCSSETWKRVTSWVIWFLEPLSSPLRWKVLD